MSPTSVLRPLAAAPSNRGNPGGFSNRSKKRCHQPSFSGRRPYVNFLAVECPFAAGCPTAARNRKQKSLRQPKWVNGVRERVVSDNRVLTESYSQEPDAWLREMGATRTSDMIQFTSCASHGMAQAPCHGSRQGFGSRSEASSPGLQTQDQAVTH